MIIDIRKENMNLIYILLHAHGIKSITTLEGEEKLTTQFDDVISHRYRLFNIVFIVTICTISIDIRY